MKYIVVLTYFDDCDTLVCKYNSRNKMLQDIFFENIFPEDKHIKDPEKYSKEIEYIIENAINDLAKTNDWHIFYALDGEVEELHMNKILMNEFINAYLTNE